VACCLTKFTNCHAADLAVSGQALQRFGMDFEQSGSLVRVKERLE